MYKQNKDNDDAMQLNANTCSALLEDWNTPFSFYKNHVYKNVEAQITPKITSSYLFLCPSLRWNLDK